MISKCSGSYQIFSVYKHLNKPCNPNSQSTLTCSGRRNWRQNRTGREFGCRRREDLRKWGDVCLVAEVGELWDPINWASWWFIYSKGRPLIGFLVCTMPPWRHGRGHQSCLHTSIKLQEGTLSIIFVEFFILSERPWSEDTLFWVCLESNILNLDYK